MENVRSPTKNRNFGEKNEAFCQETFQVRKGRKGKAVTSLLFPELSSTRDIGRFCYLNSNYTQKNLMG